MHAVDLDQANLATQAALHQAAALAAGYELLGVSISELRPNDRLVDRVGEKWSGLPTVRCTIPLVTQGLWQIDFYGHRSAKTARTRLSIWRPLTAAALVA